MKNSKKYLKLSDLPEKYRNFVMFVGKVDSEELVSEGIDAMNRKKWSLEGTIENLQKDVDTINKVIGYLNEKLEKVS